MAATVIQTPHAALNKYRTKLQQTAAELETTTAVVKRIAEKLNEGALVGRAGTAMSTALTEKLTPSIQSLLSKMLEEDSDIKKHQGDDIARNRQMVQQTGQ
jgi:hypothetical protein